MSARVLVVDDIETNRRLLEARLSAEYFEVLQAADGHECLKLAQSHEPDLILLDVMMPGIDGFETCRRLKAEPATRHIPVVMVTALDQRSDRIRGLEAGADDFLTKPVDDVALFARVRSLLRLKLVMDELRLRHRERECEAEPDAPLQGGAVLVVGADAPGAERLAARLCEPFTARAVSDPREAAYLAGEFDLMIVDVSNPRFDGLRLCARVRSDAATRQLPILAVVEADDRRTMVRALDLGVNDVIARPIDAGELAARARTQIRRKAYADTLRDRLDESLEMAVKDPLTGLFNRRYALSRLNQALDGLAAGGEPVSAALIDIDHFKRINDTFGHATGDAVLKGFSARLMSELRAVDIAARFGGEEFILIFPGAQVREAMEAAERVRAAVAREPFPAPEGREAILVTLSAGVAEARPGDDVEDLLARADSALYEAKASGRNQVVDAKKKAA
ncbi:PleD family two-component system response regulator [Alkalicaulis satelles]|uniref:diguanylate cyclase n=1 Tax=Alkalicaulis satelles TaxID=2609175 RepID=A0A5M6ZBI5_9PROT|nr:PleD family two-component system response regulator [Alkalicaulis satelles]KAA5801695.1 PleD family two-component system response regulator [Alkalicaulis satelles]